MIPNTGQIFDPSASNEYNGVILQGMAFARDVSCHFDTV
jgi:hypothetical protein